MSETYSDAYRRNDAFADVAHAAWPAWRGADGESAAGDLEAAWCRAEAEGANKAPDEYATVNASARPTVAAPSPRSGPATVGRASLNIIQQE
jgi:hypothetical protein